MGRFVLLLARLASYPLSGIVCVNGSLIYSLLTCMLVFYNDNNGYHIGMWGVMSGRHPLYGMSIQWDVMEYCGG